MKKGFTLIELLIVVLIIGVLTAVALPQYQTAVEKSRYGSFAPLAKSVKDAEEVFHIASAAYSPDLEALDAQVPGTISGSTVNLSDGTKVEVTAEGTHNYVKVSQEGLENNYVSYFDYSANYPGEIHCEALNDSEKAQRLCTSLGGTELGSGVTSGYTAYILQGTGSGSAASGGSSGEGAGTETGSGSTGSSSNGEESSSPVYSTEPPSAGWQWIEDVGAWDRLCGYYTEICGESSIDKKEYVSNDQIRLTLTNGDVLDLTLASGESISDLASAPPPPVSVDFTVSKNGESTGQRVQMEKHYGSWFWD